MVSLYKELISPYLLIILFVPLTAKMEVIRVQLYLVRRQLEIASFLFDGKSDLGCA